MRNERHNSNSAHLRPSSARSRSHPVDGRHPSGHRTRYSALHRAGLVDLAARRSGHRRRGKPRHGQAPSGVARASQTPRAPHRVAAARHPALEVLRVLAHQPPGSRSSQEAQAAARHGSVPCCSTLARRAPRPPLVPLPISCVEAGRGVRSRRRPLLSTNLPQQLTVAEARRSRRWSRPTPTATCPQGRWLDSRSGSAKTSPLRQPDIGSYASSSGGAPGNAFIRHGPRSAFAPLIPTRSGMSTRH